MRRTSNQEKGPAGPFFKWAGGKGQLIPEFEARFPEELRSGRLTRYVEPFTGGGAVFFHVVQTCPVREAILCDVNEELVLTYRAVREDVMTLIRLLSGYQERYDSLDEEGRSRMFYEIRDDLNAEKKGFDYTRMSPAWAERAAKLIFLNRTCFNGLFRLNSKGEFNVPFGRYKHPRIVNEPNLLKVSALLANTRILLGDFESCREFIDRETFVYIDPPYRPISRTAKFTSYSQDGFSDGDQRRLAAFFAGIDQTGAKIMLSNSDPKNEDPEDEFFDDLYRKYRIERVLAKRLINSVAEKRGEIHEIIVMNYDPPDGSSGPGSPD